jgi:hypothetical protein
MPETSVSQALLETAVASAQKSTLELSAPVHIAEERCSSVTHAGLEGQVYVSVDAPSQEADAVVDPMIEPCGTVSVGQRELAGPNGWRNEGAAEADDHVSCTESAEISIVGQSSPEADSVYALSPLAINGEENEATGSTATEPWDGHVQHSLMVDGEQGRFPFLGDLDKTAEDATDPQGDVRGIDKEPPDTGQRSAISTRGICFDVNVGHWKLHSDGLNVNSLPLMMHQRYGGTGEVLGAVAPETLADYPRSSRLNGDEPKPIRPIRYPEKQSHQVVKIGRTGGSVHSLVCSH